MVRKPNNSWCPCGDYRRLNLITEPDHYPMLNMNDLTASIGDARIFSKLDLLKGYFQVPVHPDDVPKTAIVTPFGSYVFYYSTFGLRNSGATFQRMMDQIFGKLPFCVVYVDILIFSRDHQKHHQHVWTILHLLKQNGLVVSPDKCIFGASGIDLGYKIQSQGIRPQANKVDAVLQFPTPTSVKGVQQFLGMINYYHRFIPGAASILAPLQDAVAGNKTSLTWSHDQEKAFTAAKIALARDTILARPSPMTSSTSQQTPAKLQ
ncbi:hypothetical protein C7M84_009595 [Penaeus vannamei]|uniref:RNA-directed DNA polymerase n=1 Tax=Penaeus vannamei TaxID=6689 RepID=A0A3R7MXK4_PENVA|nr:hypothetical protein C7M84_009595 [Penaeus vannamei]